MDSSEDKCNMNKNSTVDCTKAFVDEPKLAPRGKEVRVGGRGFEVVRGLSIAGFGGVSECSPPHHCSYSASTFQTYIFHN